MYAHTGKYFATSTHTLALMIHSKKIHSKKTESEGTQTLYISDGGLGIFDACQYFGCPPPNCLKVRPSKLSYHVLFSLPCLQIVLLDCAVFCNVPIVADAWAWPVHQKRKAFIVITTY